MWGPKGPSVSRSRGVFFSEEGRAAHGPLHPALLSSELLIFSYEYDVQESVLCLFFV